MRKGIIGILVGFAAIACIGCSTRSPLPVAGEDSTITYPSKKPGGVEASITLYEKTSKKSGKLLGVGRVFTMGEDEKVRSLIEIKNAKAMGNRPLHFHALWLDPEGNALYLKEFDLAPDDSAGTLESSISIPPDKREPGVYALKLYLFRELIAEKSFEVRREEKG